MRTKVPLKLQKIIEEIDQRGQAGMTRLTVLKKWFERPERLRSFGIWMAIRAVELGAEADGNDDDERALFDVVKTLLTDADVLAPALDHESTRDLYHRLRQFQHDYKSIPFGSCRLIKNWNLYLVEEGLRIYLGNHVSPSHGYKLAADYCQHYNPRFGTSLNGPSRTKVEEILHFVVSVEHSEDGV